MDHYRVLGLSVSASTSAIRAAYRRLAVALHPDRAGAASTAAFQKVAAAYEVLSDPVKRSRYDERLLGQQQRPRPATARSGTLDALPRVSGALRSLLASGILQRIDETSFELRLTGEEADSGGYVSISTPRPNQLLHWITIPPGSIDGDIVSSVVRAGESRSVLQLTIRVTR